MPLTVEAAREADRAEAQLLLLRMEGLGGPAQPSPTIAQCLNGGYANGVTWLGTIHGQAAWIRLRLSGTRWHIGRTTQMNRRGVEFTVTQVESGLWKWQFQIDETVTTGKTYSNLMGMAAHRVQQRIDRELNKAEQTRFVSNQGATLSRTDRPQ